MPVEMNEKLLKTGDTSRLEVVRAKRQLNELQSRANSVRYKLEERRSVPKHTALTAPVVGSVKTLKVNTIGGVLRAGDERMQISPTEVAMVLEIKLNPIDIGQLKIGLPVSIQLDALDYSVCKSLSGRLGYLSADTLVNQTPSGQAVAFYRAQLKKIPITCRWTPTTRWLWRSHRL